MASPALDLGEITQPQESPPDSACKEAQKWIEQVTGRSFGDKDFRTGLENGILLCELLNAIKPGVVKKINRLPTPIAGLDNITLFLRGCKELGLKESQLFDPGDLQDTSNRTTVRTSENSRKLRNVLVTVYWLGKIASSCTSYGGKNLDLKEFEGLLAQMRKENEEIESPKRSIRDSGYIDCWDSERSDSLSPPRHGRDDSFDSLDSFGSRSQQTPSPDVILRGSSDGRGSDSESDLPHRRLPDVRKDDMSARRVSFGENKAFVPFNQYLPNKSNHTAYIPAPLRKKKAEREDYRKSWSTATSPLGGERTFSPNLPETIKEEKQDVQCVEDGTKEAASFDENKLEPKVQLLPREGEEKEQSANSDISGSVEEIRRLKNLEQAGIRVMPANKRYGSQKQSTENESAPDIVLRKENAFLMCHEGMDSEEEEETRVPDIEKDDLATRRARMNRPKAPTQFNQYIHGSYINKKIQPHEVSKTQSAVCQQKAVEKSNHETLVQKEEIKIVTRRDDTHSRLADNESHAPEEQEKVPDIQRDDLAKRRTQGSASQHKEPLVFAAPAITTADLKTWQRLKVSSEDSESLNQVTKQPNESDRASTIDVTRATNDDFGRRKLSLHEKRARNKQKFVHFGPVTEIDQKRWDRLCIAKAGEEYETDVKDESASDVVCVTAVMSSTAASVQTTERTSTAKVLQNESSSLFTATSVEFSRETLSPAPSETEEDGQLLNTKRDDMLARRTGTFHKFTRINQVSAIPNDPSTNDSEEQKETMKTEQNERKPEILQAESQQLSRLLLSDSANRDLRLKSSSSALEIGSLTNIKSPAVVRNDCQEGSSNFEKETNVPNPEKDDMMTRRVSITQKPVGVGLGHFLPVPFSLQQKEEDKTRASSQKEKKSAIPSRSIVSYNPPQALAPVRCDSPTKPSQQNDTEEHVGLRDDLTQTCDSIQSNSVVTPSSTQLDSQLQETLGRCEDELRFSSRSSLSDDAESVSMCDMRYDEEITTLPHSRIHQEHLQTVNDLLKEEDDSWQDDLARWKTRRRSASQDLIKKEEERKKMERLLSGDSDLAQRRKSIKTYKEIVEEKERREKELHEAYKNAKSKEEAEKILQKYIEKFTISEAVLERLVMPKILERSQSVEPSLLSSTEDPNPLKYLRQQSLPSPKYTATVEATIASSKVSETKGPAGRTSPSKSVVSKVVPMLTPKPYSQPKNTQQVLKTFRVDGKINMNGEASNGTEELKESEFESRRFIPSLSRSQRFEGVTRVDPLTVEITQDAACMEMSSTSANTQNMLNELKIVSEESNHVTQDNEVDYTTTKRLHSEETRKEVTNQHQTQDSSSVSSLQFTPSLPLKDPSINGKNPEEERKVEANVLIMHWSLDSNLKEQKESGVSLLNRPPEDGPESAQGNQFVEAECRDNSPTLIPNLNSPNRFCSWDPEEERKRQERWQQEQERMLQERYQKEQEKLKEEWEKAQKEVEEEERKYYEEERKIIEDTVVPLTMSTNTSMHFSESERNGISVEQESGQTERENNAGMLWANSQQYVKDDVQSEQKQQPAQWAQEGTLHQADLEQTRGNLNNSRFEMDPAMDNESESGNHVSSRECNTPTRLTLQFGDQWMRSGENHLSGEDGAQNNCIPENNVQQRSVSPGTPRGTEPHENARGVGYSSPSPSSQCQSPNRSVSGKKLCSTCGLPLGKGAAMIIETLSLYFHIQCFKCGICKGQLGDSTTGTDVRIRNGLLNCNDCYMRSRTAGHPTPL
ncbi:LIM and calponin homology domains-containing protein 1 [Discoglossus pictus]